MAASIDIAGAVAPAPSRPAKAGDARADGTTRSANSAGRTRSHGAHASRSAKTESDATDAFDAQLDAVLPDADGTGTTKNKVAATGDAPQPAPAERDSGEQARDQVTTGAVLTPWMTPADAATATWSHVESLLLRAGWFLGAIALADYGWQRFRLLQTMKMTRQEVKDEVRQNEGSGEVKGRIRRLQREMSKRRMLRDIARATVVITNPTHFAVALEYQRESMVAPKVLAKGADHLALKIRERAMQHGVPVIENKPLARSLYATAEIGDTIPAPLFAAVAEVLAYLVRIKRLLL